LTPNRANSTQLGSFEAPTSARDWAPANAAVASAREGKRSVEDRK
jgi:hypothetical protein